MVTCWIFLRRSSQKVDRIHRITDKILDGNHQESLRPEALNFTRVKATVVANSKTLQIEFPSSARKQFHSTQFGCEELPWGQTEQMLTDGSIFYISSNTAVKQHAQILVHGNFR